MFGYDPIEDQYKVLAVDDWYWRGQHKVAVLGGGWRDVMCVACPHMPHTMGLNMNGTLYYGASRTDIDYPDNSIIMSFDVRHENFNIIKVPSKFVPVGFKNMWVATYWVREQTDKTLINYGGKVGVVENPSDQGRFRLWVVEDAEREEWSMHTFLLPTGLDLKVMDTFSTGEICLVPNILSGGPLRLYYYNLEKESMRIVTIKEVNVSYFKKAGTSCVTVSDLYESFMFV
ncbi:unnamed protein product [Eruca vesicaria subsp. sativa]|uniref:F-box associated beta-propeller type 3 domain-containing protein n=1 Tax=Eruca vesicaria subsp. sativa TaxID=29727 RepID=A0ABC8M9B8_ERUVS|nr:unnamed protein product [Eruca vesicaria subsp. sativa]